MRFRIRSDFTDSLHLNHKCNQAFISYVGRLRGVRCASILNVVAGFHKNVAESVGRYQNGEQAAPQWGCNSRMTRSISGHR